MIGALRNKLQLLNAERVGDGGGGAGIIWVPGPEIWAAIERLPSTRDFAGDRDNRLRRIAATIRFQADVTLGARVLFDDVSFEVASIEDDQPGRRLTLICEEVLV